MNNVKIVNGKEVTSTDEAKLFLYGNRWVGVETTMTRDDIIRMAKEAGLTQKPFCRWGGYLDDLMRFAALVAAEKEQQMIRDGYRKCASGQRTTQFCGLLDAAVKAEREACAKVCEKEQFELTQDVAGKNGLQHFDAGCRSCAGMIRARGE